MTAMSKDPRGRRLKTRIGAAKDTVLSTDRCRATIRSWLESVPSTNAVIRQRPSMRLNTARVSMGIRT
jgi:hypothetical protein